MALHQITVRVANETDIVHIAAILFEIENASRTPGTGICKRSHEQLAQRICEGNAVIALTQQDEWVGFCYIQAWDNDRFVSTCALVVAPAHRRSFVATRVKTKAFALAQKKYPKAKLFGLTTSLAVMKINSDLGFQAVTYSEIVQDDAYWAACKTCPHHDILLRKGRKACLCTAMLFDPFENLTEELNGRNPAFERKDETSLQKKMQNVQVL